MRCSRARKLLSAAYDGELRADRRVSIDRHLAGCSACRQFEADLLDLAAGLDCLAVPEPRWGFTERLVARLAEQNTGSAESGGWLGFLRPAPVGVGAVAFSLGVLLTILVNSETNGDGVSEGAARESETTEYVTMITEDPMGQLMSLLPGEEN